jgi:hypothetical protein
MAYRWLSKQMITGVCAVLEIGFVVRSKYWDWMACRMLHDVSVSTQQDSVILGCGCVIRCIVPMLCSSIVYSSSRSDSVSMNAWSWTYYVLKYWFVHTQSHSITSWQTGLFSDTTVRMSYLASGFVLEGDSTLKWNFTVLLPYKRQGPLMLLCSANQQDQIHNYILFAVNVCMTLFVVA